MLGQNQTPSLPVAHPHACRPTQESITGGSNRRLQKKIVSLSTIKKGECNLQRIAGTPDGSLHCQTRPIDETTDLFVRNDLTSEPWLHLYRVKESISAHKHHYIHEGKQLPPPPGSPNYQETLLFVETSNTPLFRSKIKPIRTYGIQVDSVFEHRNSGELSIESPADCRKRLSVFPVRPNAITTKGQF